MRMLRACVWTLGLVCGTAMAQTAATDTATIPDWAFRPGGLGPLAAAPDAGSAGATTSAEDEEACEKSLRLPWGPIQTCKAAVITTAVATTAAVSFAAWWSQGFTTQFNFAQEGWFGPDTYSGGMDKLGHFFGFYVGTRLGSDALAWARVPADEAIWLSAAINFGVGFGIEVLDAMSREGVYGFSWQDLTMDALGIGLGVLMQFRPELDRYFAVRWLYSPSGRPDSWYDHQIYLIAFRLSGPSAIGRDNPLRYFELLAGYGAKGFNSDFDYSQGDTRQRTVYLGIGLNLTEIFDRTVFSGSWRGSRTQRITDGILRYVQVPGTAAAVSRTWRP